MTGGRGPARRRELPNPHVHGNFLPLRSRFLPRPTEDQPADMRKTLLAYVKPHVQEDPLSMILGITYLGARTSGPAWRRSASPSS
jgi:hypothetical protein